MGRLSDHIEARRESGPVAFPAADRSVLSLHWTPGHGALWLAGVDAAPAQGAAQLYFPPSPEPLPCTELFDQCWFLTSLSTSSLSFQFLCENYRTHSIHCPLKRQPQDLWLCHLLVRLPVETCLFFMLSCSPSLSPNSKCLPPALKILAHSLSIKLVSSILVDISYYCRLVGWLCHH